MLKVNFPKTPREIKLCWCIGNGYYAAMAESKNSIIIYEWDGISLNYNKASFYPKAEVDYDEKTI